MRIIALSLTNASTSTTLFSSQRGYDGVGKVTSVNTTLAARTDNQAFCYDEQNRLTWAGSSGTPPCGSTAITAGTLTAANYTQSFSYDALNRLTTGPLFGGYTYGDAAHPHAATEGGHSLGCGLPCGPSTPTYTASYDAAGDMTCRAPDTSATCEGATPTGQQMTYDNERRLTHWQNTPSAPTSTADYVYDGEGQRVAQRTSTGSATSTTYYLGGLEEATSDGTTTTLTKYFSVPGLPTAVRVGSTLSYLASDGLGSVSEALDGSGAVTAQQLYAPYGGTRYTSGVMPTTKGYTGQRQDAASGLDYYGARYYDPVLGQFTSADSVADGLNRYGYVHGNPTTATDPSGHWVTDGLGGAPEAGCADRCNYDDSDSNIHVHTKPDPDCPSGGCTHVTSTSASVGQGKLVHLGGGHSPTVYSWGDEKNGATATGYSGASLQDLIAQFSADLDRLQGWQNFLKSFPQWIAFGVGVTAAIITYIGLQLEGVDGKTAQDAAKAVFGVAFVAGGLTEEALGNLLQGVIDHTKADIAELQQAYANGLTVWMVQSTWNGQAGKYSGCGGGDFCIGSGATPTLSVYRQVALDMMGQCRDAPATQWDGSPGIPASSPVCS